MGGIGGGGWYGCFDGGGFFWISISRADLDRRIYELGRRMGREGFLYFALLCFAWRGEERGWG